MRAASSGSMPPSTPSSPGILRPITKSLPQVDRIASQTFSLSEKPVKRAQRRELQANVRTRLSALHDGEEVIAKIIRCAFLPRRFVCGVKSFQRLPVSFQRARRCISLDDEIAPEFFGNRISRVLRRQFDYSGFSITNRVLAAFARPLY